MTVGVAIVYGVIMAIAHYFSDEFCAKCQPFLGNISSFSAGVSVTYIFLILFPEFSTTILQDNKFLFLFVLVGFVIIHLVEKYIYQHFPDNRLRRELALEDSIVSFFYHFVIGIILATFVLQGSIKGFLFFVPILFFTLVSTLPVDVPQYKWVKIVLSLSTLLGILFALFVVKQFNPIAFLALLGLVIGVMSYTVFRHSLPQGKEGKPMSFVIGILFYILVIYMVGGF